MIYDVNNYALSQSNWQDSRDDLFHNHRWGNMSCSDLDNINRENITVKAKIPEP